MKDIFGARGGRVNQTLQKSFIVFRFTLGLALLYGSVTTALHGFSHGGFEHLHLGVVGAVEAVGAALFLIPQTLKAGAWLLLAILGVALVFHATQGEFRPDLLVYAAGVWFVMIHGAGSSQPQTPTAA